MTVVATTIFLLTYALIASRRLSLLPIGRPAGALLGAFAMVAAGVLTPEESYAAIDGDTILLLFSMMVVAAYLERAGLFDRLASAVLARARTPWRLLVAVSLVSGVGSAFLVNDTVCLFLTPIVVTTCVRAGLPLGPYLLAVATSANIGSAATLVGNPQNMIIGSLSDVSFSRFSALCAPAALVGLAINLALLAAFFRRELPPTLASAPRTAPARPGLAWIVLAGIIVAFFAGAHLGYAALAGALAFVVAERHDPRETFARVDWPLLIFFAALFVVVRGLASTGMVEALWEDLSPLLDLASPGGLASFTALMTAGSNVFSNVPMVLLTGPRLEALGYGELGWALLGFVTTVAGNLTLLGSVANIIVAEGAREHYTLGFMEYLRFGLVSTLLVLAAGVPLIAWLA
ncbi:MAG: 46 kDa membrane protein [Myxococcales bacterium]